jgi:2-polyprenyl-6-methoxyphenol hydroxylase-like FAD-dependent oxidoreductase
MSNRIPTGHDQGSVDGSGIVIIGAGPVGLTASLLLSRYKVPHLLVEQRRKPMDHPQAHYISIRSMEIFREFDGLEQKIRAESAPLDEWRRYIYCKNIVDLPQSCNDKEPVVGSLLGVRDHFPAGPDRTLSPVWECNLPQNQLERLLREAVGTSHYCRFLEGRRVAEIRERGDGVQLKIMTVSSGTFDSIRCRYAVCADGAHSDTRRQLGIFRRKKTGVLQHLINVHFFSPALARMMRATLTGMLYFVYSPHGVGVFVNHGLQRGEFVLQLPYFPPHQQPDDFTRRSCETRIQELVGGPISVDVRSIRPWRLRAWNAERYRSEQGRCFLAGDAAHQMLPAGGFGMNSGIADVHNLMWKLALSLRTTAEERADDREAMLASYQTERQPVAERCIERSIQNYTRSLAVPAAIGIEPQAAKLLDVVLRWIPAPSFLRRRVFATAMRIGLSQIKLLERDNLVGKIRRKDLAELFADPTNTLALRFPKQDLGVVYRRGWLEAGSHSNHDETDADTFNTRLRTGGRMPHCELNGAGKQTGPRSCVDLPAHAVDDDGTPVHLLLSIDLSRHCEAELEKRLSRRFYPLKIIRLGSNGESDLRLQSPRPAFLPKTGAVLLRPDGHVAFHTMSH